MRTGFHSDNFLFEHIQSVSTRLSKFGGVNYLYYVTNLTRMSQSENISWYYSYKQGGGCQTLSGH